MHYLTFDGTEHEQYDIAFLVPRLNEEEIRKRYIEKGGFDPSSIIAFDLHLPKKKTPVVEQKQYLKELFSILKELKVKFVVICDSDYFKTTIKETKAERWLGYIKQAREDIDPEYRPSCIYCPSFTGIFYDPEKVLAKIDQALSCLASGLIDAYTAPGSHIIKFAAYPSSRQSIHEWLQRLLDMDVDLTCDIEGFSLKHYDAGIGTIAFAWNQNEGIAFPVDYKPIPQNENKEYGEFVVDPEIKAMLREFFRLFKRKLIFHNISYDATVLIYQLFMSDILDTAGLLDGMDHMLKNWDDTKLITYLATNSCSGNKLGLKDQAQEFAGNYAQDEIKDIRRIPLDDLLQYNLVDALSTWYVWNKNHPQMVADNQVDIYETIFKPAILDVVQMQLTGLPINRDEVANARQVLQADLDDAVQRMNALPLVQEFTQHLNMAWVVKRNSELKVKRVTIDDANETFNPNSDKQLQELLYNRLGLPVLDLTDSKLPSTGKDTLKKLKLHTADQDIIAFLNALIDYKDVVIILTIFIPAFERSVQGPDGWYYLFGNFNLGGTVSGRLSSNDPNLQNIPATGSKYAKLIKHCVQAPPGWLFCGLDFNSLEDMISALTTKDPNKLKVYTDGYDGHSLRAFFYFRELMPDILDTVDSINSIQEKYKPLRQESKAPTFALTYQGTYMTLMVNCGFSEEKAKMIEERYHQMYVVSDKWVQDRLNLATQTGYVTAAFGLKVRTPLLKQVILGTRQTPYEAAAEGRTAGNALGQSWCLLNSRASSEFMGKVRSSQYRLDIRICAQIHDASYYLVRDDLPIFQFLNKHLVKAAKWQNHPDIAHDQVKLGGEAFICFPSWAYECGIKNNVTDDELKETIHKYVEKLKEKAVL